MLMLGTCGRDKCAYYSDMRQLWGDKGSCCGVGPGVQQLRGAMESCSLGVRETRSLKGFEQVSRPKAQKSGIMAPRTRTVNGGSNSST